MAAERVDWTGLMRVGLGALRLAPDAFWAMTPGELRLALEGAGLVPVSGAVPMPRERLGELMAAFPDGRAPGGAGGTPSLSHEGEGCVQAAGAACSCEEAG